MARKRKGRCAKNNTAIAAEEPEHLKRAPHSFVFYRGDVGKYIASLMRDFRKLMEPFTASKLQVRRSNTIKDLVSVAGPLHVSHLAMFTCTEMGPYVRFARVPHGPTLTFRIHEYVLSRDVISSLKKSYIHAKLFQDPPLIIMNGFSTNAPHFKLMTTMFQGMFPTINVTKVDLNTVRRCVLMNYDPETKQIEMRHYSIRVKPIGLSKSVKKLVSSKVPNLSKYRDISDFVTRGDISESEVEDDEKSHIELPQDIISRGNMKGGKSAIRLSEIGPRITMQLIKVEGGLMDGEVMFHEYIVKTEEEKALLAKRREEKRKLKEKRKKQQEVNVKKKEVLKEELKKKSLEGIAKKKEATQGDELENDRLMKEAAKEGALQEDDDDAEWFRKEVGKEPEPEFFTKTNNGTFKRKLGSSNFRPYKKKKVEGRKPSFSDRGKSGENKKFTSNKPHGQKSGMKRNFGDQRKGSGMKRNFGDQRKGSGMKRDFGEKRKGFGTRVSQGVRHKSK